MTVIEWTDATWNPVTGCDRVSPGCAHCYALDLAARLKGMGQARYQKDGNPKTSGPGFGLTLHPDKLDEPLRWRKPRRVFVNSMSDLFHEEIPDEYLRTVFAVMASAHQHTFQVLTKRPERMLAFFQSHHWRDGLLFWHAPSGRKELLHTFPIPNDKEPGGIRREDGDAPSNIWLGVSIENRRFVHRADLLRQTPAAVRFVSAEPLLGPLDGLSLDDIDWLIAGGESGPRHRWMSPEWVRDLRDACEWNGTAFFFKQWGGRTPKAGGRELDGRTWDEYPADLVLSGVNERPSK